MKKYGKALTWDELADIYDKTTHSRARTKPMEHVWNWAERQIDKFYVHPKHETIHLIKGGK